MSDQEWEARKRRIKRFIDAKLDNVAFDRSDSQDVAREVSDQFGVILTEREVRDINRSGW